jgi:DNA-binding NtrC family response regulator
LRERVEDIEALATFFLNTYAKKYNREQLSMSHSVLTKLQSYQWPGNIRELEHTIEKAVILGNGIKIKSDDILFRPIKAKQQNIPETIEEMEKFLILNALDKQNGNYSSAATQLGITRQTLYNKIKKYGI